MVHKILLKKLDKELDLLNKINHKEYMEMEKELVKVDVKLGQALMKEYKKSVK